MAPSGRQRRPSRKARSRPGTSAVIVASTPSPQTAQGEALSIAGMHRSGTSMVARLLYDCGLNLGDERDLAPAKPDNPDGFWENQRFVDLNEEVFAHFSGGWDLPPSLPSDWQGDEELQKLRVKAELLVEPFRGPRPWGWKDPRNSITFPFWKSILPNLKVIICLRHPLEVALSLRNRNFLSCELGLTLWAIYNRRIMESTTPEERLIVHYGAFFQQPAVELRRIAEFSGLAPDAQQAETALQRIRPDFRHASFDTRHLIDISLSPETIRIYLALASEAGWLDGAREVSRSDSGRAAPRLLGGRNGHDGELVQREPSAVGTGKLNRGALELELLRRSDLAAREEIERRSAYIQGLEERLRELERERQNAKPEVVPAANASAESIAGERALLEAMKVDPRDETSKPQSELDSVRAELSKVEALSGSQNLEAQRLRTDLERAQAEVVQATNASAESIAEERALLEAMEVELRHEKSELQSELDSMRSELSKVQGLSGSQALETQRLRTALGRVEKTLASTETIVEQYAAAFAAVDALLPVETKDDLPEGTPSIESRIAQVPESIADGERAAVKTKEAIEEMVQRATEAQRDRDASRALVESSRESVTALSNELEAIHKSRLWRVGSTYWRALDWLRRRERR